MARRVVTIRDVAAMARVSPGTVSNVLGGRKPVAEALAARVREAARRLGYQADRAASVLRSGRARIIAILVPDLDNPFYTAVIAAVEDRARQDGYEVFVASSREDVANETGRLSALLAWRPAGVVVISTSDGFPGQTLLEQAGTPYVLADRSTERLVADLITVDGEDAGAVGAAHLVALGHERVLIAASSLRVGNMRERCEGAARHLSRHGGSPDVVELGMSFDEAIVALRRWFERHTCPTAILAMTNFTTLGALAVLAERGLAVPGQVSLIGFDDYSWMRARVTPLTAIRQPVSEMGALIWERLSARIGGDTAPPARIALPCELMVRASTAPREGSRASSRLDGRYASPPPAAAANGPERQVPA